MTNSEVFERGAGIFTFTTAVITFISTIFVVGYELHQMLSFVTNKVKLFPRMITWIALCEAITSFLIFVGMLTNDRDFCPAQSGLWQFFGRASWNWTLMLAVQLDRVIIRKAAPLEEWKMHAIIWSVGIFFEIIPFFAKGISYGADDDHLSSQIDDQKGTGGVSFKFICTGFLGPAQAANLITIVVFTGYLIAVIVLLASLNYRLYNFLNQSKNEKIMSVAIMLRRYPLSLCLFWLPNIVLASIVNFCNTRSCSSSLDLNNLQPGFVLTLGFSNLYGLTLAVIYAASYIRNQNRSSKTSGSDLGNTRNPNYNDSIFRASFSSQLPQISALEDAYAAQGHSPMTGHNNLSHSLPQGNILHSGGSIISVSGGGGLTGNMIHTAPITHSTTKGDGGAMKSRTVSADSDNSSRNISRDSEGSHQRFSSRDYLSTTSSHHQNNYNDDDEEDIISEASRSTSNLLGNSKSDLLEKLTDSMIDSEPLSSTGRKSTTRVSLSLSHMKHLQTTQYSLSDDEGSSTTDGGKEDA